MAPLRRARCVLFLLLPFAASLNVKRWDNFQLKHEWAVEAPKDWDVVGPAPPHHLLPVRIGLKQDRLPELIDNLYQVSDPAHPRYGAHLSKEEVEALVAPHPDSVDLVMSWLAYHGVDLASVHSPTGAGDWISVTTTVDKVEKMLGTKYNVYKHKITSETIVRTTSYSLPSIIHGHVAVVTPATYFGTIKAMRSAGLVEESVISNSQVLSAAANLPTNCSTHITPLCLRTLYNTTNYVPQAVDKNSLGIAGYLDEFTSYLDYASFVQAFRPDAIGSNFTVVQVNGGGNDQSKPGVEANLDIQYAEGLSFPTPNIYYSTGGSPPFTQDAGTITNTNEPYLDWLHYILAQNSIPQTFSTSYADDEQTVPQDYAETVCNLLAQLGARGSTVLFASGDYGAAGASNCTANDGKNTTKLIPTFPASCPFVTAVGSTYEIPAKAVYFSGGGFSNYFPAPHYQKTAVSTYMQSLGGTNAGLYNASGRGFPDVAAHGLNFQVYLNGTIINVGGTSASTPTVAAIFALLNDYRIANGKPPMGFINPWLYSKGKDGFNLITDGTSSGCSKGFAASNGWSPVTGWGTPDFVKLQGLVDQNC